MLEISSMMKREVLMKLNIMEWNVNFGADKNANMCSFANKYIENVDIIIFTEVVQNASIDEALEKMDCEYVQFVSKPCDSEWYNQIVIAVKAELKDRLKINKVEIDEKKWNLDELPDILHITIEICEGRLLNVIGTRVRIDIFNNDEDDYKSRCAQFKKLAEYLQLLENVFVMGDFNNGMIKAEADCVYSDVQKKYEFRWDKEKEKYVKSLLRFYNFHMMKDILGEGYVLDEVMGEDSSWGLSIYNGELSYGLIKNDQIISKNVELVECSYDWLFVRENEQVFYDMLYRNRYKKGNKINHGYPEHAILKAEINI